MSEHRQQIPARELSTNDEQYTCARYGTPEPRPHAFRLLPGSRHLFACPACSGLLRTGKERLSKTLPGMLQKGGAS